ncbi:MAG: hypothetical protein AB7O24_26665 [Kofleriaceae bacterium]
MRSAWLLGAIVLAGASGAAVMIALREPAATPAPVIATPAPAVRIPNSDPPGEDTTIFARDYIGPDACSECHPDQHARWSGSLHAVMNQRASTAAAVIGNWNGAAVDYAGGQARFDHDRDGYRMTLRRGRTEVAYRVTRTIGRRGLQEYVGVELGRADAVEVRLPFGWWPRRAGWYPQPYLDPWLGDEASFDAYAPVRERWAERCPWCHSTYPLAQRIARASRPDPVGHGLEQFFIAEPGGDALDVSAQVTTGISCESCHLGGRAHAAGAPIHFVPNGATARPGAPVASRFSDERRDPAIVNTVCAQCHSGPSPRFPDGSASRNSSEAIDLVAGTCTGITCIDCHDPHRADSRGDHGRAIAACVRCHQPFADAARARAHAGHDGVDCTDCHMPALVMGIDRFVASHRISLPSNPAMLFAGAPNACNLCHPDRSLQWTLDELREQYQVRVDVPARTSLRFDRPMGDLWLASRQPALRMLGAAAYARSPLGRTMLPRIAQQLTDPQPHVRAWAMFALEDVLGRRIDHAELDPRAPSEHRARQLARFPR